jgi:RND family efflux transporter MFP subunit
MTTITTTAITALALGCLAAGCAAPEAAAPLTTLPVTTHEVTAAATASTVRYSASIEPFEQVTLAFKASGYVESILQRAGADGRMRPVQPGDRIARGAVLARVRDTEYRQRVSQGRARLGDNEALLTKARLDLARAQTLFASDSLTKPELDAAQAAFDSADARVASARADVDLALTSLADTALVAPSGGVVLERRIEAGSLAGMGTAAFVMADVSAVKARFGIPDGMIHTVRLGQAIDVVIEAADGTAFGGRVTAIAPAAEAQSRVFDVEITIANADGRLRPGMIGTVALDRPTAAGDSPDAPLSVPLTAIVRPEAGSERFAVLVVERDARGEVARLRPVELGDVVGNGITVLRGVQAGDRVVSSAASMLVDGQRVTTTGTR